MPGPLFVIISSRPNGPPDVYAYITNTNGSKLALRIAVRVAPLLFALGEIFPAFPAQKRICVARGYRIPRLFTPFYDLLSPQRTFAPCHFRLRV